MNLEDCFKKGLLKRIVPDPMSSQRSLELSRSHLDDAEENLYIMRYRVVIVSSYTAMFHAAKAILFRDGIKERGHECIPIYLKMKYPKLMSQANVLDAYRRYRHLALYGMDLEVCDDDAISAMGSAVDFLRDAEKMIKG